MSFTFAMPAPDGGRFEPTAFVGQIGKRVPLRFESGVGAAAMSGEITAAVVAADGLSAQITVEPDGDVVMVDGDRPCGRCGRPQCVPGTNVRRLCDSRFHDQFEINEEDS